MLKTTKDIAEQFGFSINHIRKLIRDGHIQAKKMGKFYIIESNKVKSIKRRRKPNKKGI